MDALEPLMSKETIEYHYGKHLQTYVDNLNRLVADTPHEGLLLEDLILNATGPSIISEELGQAITRDFGSYENFEKKFKEAAIGIFGSGWAWLAEEKTAQKTLKRYVCITCRWIYDPVEGDSESGIPPGTPFEDTPEEWLCPACGVGKDMFEEER